MHADDAVVLTATIRPQTVGSLNVTDSVVRQRQYETALDHWMRVAPGGVAFYFVENSGADLDSFARIARMHNCSLTLISVPPPDPSRGKGHGEALMLERAAVVLKQEHRLVFKCTGRLSVPNARSLLPIGCVPEIVCSFKPGLQQMDVRLLVTTPELLGTLAGEAIRQVNEATGVWLEHAAARTLLRAIADGHAYRPFRALPRFCGISGSTGEDYGSLRARLRRAAASPVRSLLYHYNLSL